ncbi:GFA family protein [Paracoccus saliphilus]|uniref:GFA family protein n=1 Tax=Paracoccus saliphilus TaxID=405559 RepID=A0AA46A6B5_9RHOB|nr:GFA family protein [Paracoccus saliphilus]WCR05556.1 GFA family protein [Paracoccus saliphilus]SIS95553.1 Uncharacterized conserved protein [Paracoccus saliphilus]
MTCRTYRGSCHCGQVQFETDIDLDAGTAKCNCSICLKRRYWCAFVSPEQFRLQSGADKLADYQFASGSVHHRFCTTCGIAVFGQGKGPDGAAFYSVSLVCLDDVDPVELAEAPVNYFNGRDDNWSMQPNETRHL